MLFLQLSVQAAQIMAKRLMLVHDILHDVVKEGDMGSVDGKECGLLCFSVLTRIRCVARVELIILNVSR